jgi:hypothetical protein
MIIQTKSGSQYIVSLAPMTVENGSINVLHAFRHGVDGVNWDRKCVAVYPDRFDHFMASKKFEVRDGKLVGLNEIGKVTCQFYPDQVRKGMILANTKGFKSTVIAEVMDV